MRFFAFILFFLIHFASFSQILVKEPLQDLGDVFESSGKIISKFKLVNPYRNDTIRILNIETSCGCTAILTQDTLILPGSQIDLEFAYDPKDRLGLFVKSIELTTLTGNDERNKLFLKIIGNVVAENFIVEKQDADLIEYEIAPIYFYPVTPFDTSYLDFNYVSSFVDDMTYEVDFYQFTTIGFEIEVLNHSRIEELEHLIRFTQKKINREFEKRGFPKEVVFFEEPVFKLTDDLPIWSSAAIRVFSTNFDSEEREESVIKVSSNDLIEDTKLLLDYERFALPEIEEILDKINMEQLEAKLFLNGSLNLKGIVLMPWKKSDGLRKETAQKLEKQLYSKLKKTAGVGKKEIEIRFDSLGIHEDDKYRFMLWDKADERKDEQITYEQKIDEITPPLLPTYQQKYGNVLAIDTNNAAFKHFWKNCILNSKEEREVKLILESSLSTKKLDNETSNLEWAKIRGQKIKNILEEMFFKETGKKIAIQLKTFIHGPNFKFPEREVNFDFDQFNYFTLIPIVHNRSENKVGAAKPYMVNFDYYFKGINTEALGFDRFSDYIAQIVEKEGFISLRIESSISKIPIETSTSNLFLAYSRLLESEKRLKEALKKKLIDPNRILFSDERTIEQGPTYDKTVPILKYRKFHYIRIVPEKLLSNE